MADIREPWKYFTWVCWRLSKPSNSRSGSALKYQLHQSLWTKNFIKYHKVASSNTSRLEAHTGFFRLLIKGIFDPYVLWPFDKKLISYLVTRVRTRDYTVKKNDKKLSLKSRSEKSPELSVMTLIKKWWSCLKYPLWFDDSNTHWRLVKLYDFFW